MAFAYNLFMSSSQSFRSGAQIGIIFFVTIMLIFLVKEKDNVEKGKQFVFKAV